MEQKPYRPDPKQTAVLPNGTPFNVYFDHPNNNGLGQVEHAQAAYYHAQQASQHAQTGNMMGMAWHQAQAILHAHAAQGIPNKPLTQTLAPHAHEQEAGIAEHNKLMNELKPFRLESAFNPPKINKAKLVDFLKNKGKLSKSSFRDPSVDLTEVKRIEQEREPPPPTLKAVDATHPGYGETIRKMVKDRHAQRHGESAAADQDGQPQIDEDTQDRIRRAIANRGRRG